MREGIGMVYTMFALIDDSSHDYSMRVT